MKQHREQTRRVPPNGMARRLLSCFLAFLLLFFASVSLWGCGENDDGEWKIQPVSKGLHWEKASTQNGGYARTPAGLSYEPFYTSYYFNANVYDTDKVTATIYAGIDEEDFNKWYEDEVRYESAYGAITDFHIFLYMWNEDGYRFGDMCELTTEYNGFPILNGGDFLDTDTRFQSPTEILFEKCSVDTLHLENHYWREFMYAKQIVIPEELFADGDWVCITLQGCIHFENGEKRILSSERSDFYYKIEGEQVKIASEPFETEM